MRMLTTGLLFLVAGVASADVITLKNGGTLEGVVLREADGGVVVRLKYATVTLDRTDIEKIEKSKEPAGPAAPKARLSAWEKCVEALASRPWAGELRQIPATVIEKGILKNVPYMSHKSGNYEFNLYGDPDAPACLEIGVYKELVKNDDAKKECLEVMALLLGDAQDVATLRSLKFAVDKKERDGLTFEVTPETAEDAFGGWWISVYDVKELDAARATEEELKQITIDEDELKRQEAEAKKVEPKKPEPKKAEPHKVPQEVIYVWRAPEVSRARPVPRVGHVRRFYVRGYHRPGGRYVHPHGGIRR